MAKKKKRKNAKKQDLGYMIELKGLFLVIISIIGFGRFGMVGKLISGFAAFLVGPWFNVLLLALLIAGGYYIVKREAPDYFNATMMGVYIFVIGLLVISHLNYVKETDLRGLDIIKETLDNFLASMTSISNIKGGGIIGACITSLFVYAFDIEGTQMVSFALIICGIVMATGVSLIDLIKNGYVKAKQGIQDSKLKNNKDKEDIKKTEEAYDNDKKVVISSVDELTHVNNASVSNEQKVSKDEIIDTSGYKFPPITLLSNPPKTNNKANHEAIKDNVTVIEQVLNDFGITGKTVAAHIGPTVTQYELEIKAGTKLSKVLGIHREIALALGAKEVRIQAPIPGKKTIGIEIPNKVTSMVTVREILASVPKEKKDSKLLVTLGRNIMGDPVFCEINKTPHMLVAGSTGSGKSVCINSIITSILMRTKPDEVKLVLVDPKKVELSMYNGVPHLLAPVVSDPKKANIALKKIVVEMENRYELFADSKTKNIAGYNAYVEKENKKRPPEDQLRKLPFIVVIIDELADLMLVAAKEVEDSIMRITQMARAAGIHLIVATQRPSTDVITGVVKSNIPSRISFAVASGIDSRTILDMTGAEKLLGKGDMLFLPQGENTPIRVQGTYIDEEEIKKVTDFTISQQKAHYDETLTMADDEKGASTMVGGVADDYDEPLYNDIVDFIVTNQKASASLLQRRFHLGYNRASRCIDLLEERGIIGPSNGSKPREVLVKLEKKDDVDE